MSAIWTTCFVAAIRARTRPAAVGSSSRCARLDIRRRRVWGATVRKPSPSTRYSVPNLASQMRTAFANMAWKTGSSAPDELEMTRSTSAVAACRSSASAAFFPTRLEIRRRGPRASSPSFRSNEPCDRAFRSSPPCETRSPRRHSHWPRCGRAQLRIEPVNLTEPHDEFAPLIRSPRRRARAASAALRGRAHGQSAS